MKEIKPTAITEWFRKSAPAVPSHFNQSMMFRSMKRLNPYALKSTIRMLCTYHEALRACWNGNQLLVRDPMCQGLMLVEEFDLRRSANVDSDMLPIVQKIQSTIDLSKGPLVHVGHFHLPDYDAVFFSIHHLVVDGVSWRIIAEDINNIYAQISTGACKIRLPKINCTYAEYADSIHVYANSDELLKELPYWAAVSKGIRELPDEKISGKREYAGESFSVDRDVTQRVISDCIKKHGVEVNDLLLTALSRAWKKVTGQNKIALSMEGHGRESFGEHPLELERIVGWFTTIFPVLIDGSVEDITEHVKATAATMHAIPNKGFGYGTLFHIAGKEELGCTPQMTFNYLGSFEEGNGPEKLFEIDDKLPKGYDVSPKNFDSESVPLSINCLVSNGCLVGSLGYDKGVFSESKAKALMKEFTAELSML